MFITNRQCEIDETRGLRDKTTLIGVSTMAFATNAPKRFVPNVAVAITSRVAKSGTPGKLSNAECPRLFLKVALALV